MTASPSPAISIRPAVLEDVPGILPVVEAAYRSEGGWTTEAHLVRGARTDDDEVTRMIADDEVTLLVAVDDDGAILGCCYTHREDADDLGRSRAELGLFAVSPTAQSGGIGGRLLEAQAAHLAAEGVEVLFIRVLESRPELHGWYRRHGFVPTGQILPFAGDPADLAVAGLRMVGMERPLRQA
ncbi:N-acetyltransferase family protein [Brachybacterium sp. DNPG3]